MSKKEPTIDIICVLDRSGSMSSLAGEVINSYNNFLQDQRTEKGKARVTLVLFDDKYEVVYERVKLKKVPELTPKVYFARGMTSLYDAIGKTISDDRFKDTKDAIVLIQTDGYENSSQEFKKEDIKQLVKEKEALGWDFQFLGANIDAMAVGQGFGLSTDKIMQYQATNSGVRDAHMSMSAVSKAYRRSKIQEFNSSVNPNKKEEK